MFAQLPPKCGMDAAQHRAAGGIGYGKKTIISDYGDFEPKVIEKRQTRTDEIEQKIMQIRTPAEQSSARYVST